jgi:hypothetical protein
MIQRYQTRTIWRTFQHLKVPTAGGYQHCGQMCADGQHHTLHQCTLSSFLSTVCGCLTVMPHSWQCSRISPCENQWSVNITFPTEGCVLNFFLHWQCWMSPFHTLAFPPWLFVMDLFLVPGHDAPQECLTFVAILIRLVLALCQTVAFMLFCELFSYWHILYLKSSLLRMTSRAEPRLMYMWGTTSSIGTWLFRNIVWNCSMSSRIENMDRCLHGSSSVTLLLNMGSHSQTLHSVKYCSYRKVKFYHWFLPLVHLQPTKIISLHVAPLHC